LGDGGPEEGFSCLFVGGQWGDRGERRKGDALLPRESAAKRRKKAQVTILTTP
jgi:hypothetical protein